MTVPIQYALVFLPPLAPKRLEFSYNFSERVKLVYCLLQGSEPGLHLSVFLMKSCALITGHLGQRVLLALVVFLCAAQVGHSQEIKGLEGVTPRAQLWRDAHPQFVREFKRLCQAGPARSERIPVQYSLETPSRVFNNGNLPDRHLILSFDDGPHTLYTEILLRVLNKCGIKAHFFPVGRQALKPHKAKMLTRMTEKGHMVGSHSFSHQNLKYISMKRAVEEIAQGHDAITKATGVFRPFFRFPYGSGNRTPKLLEALEKRG